MKQFAFATRGGAFGNQIAYPDDVITGDVLEVDGSKLWRNVEVRAGVVFGDYLGDLPLDDYVPPQEYKTYMTKSEFLDLFSDAELGDFLDIGNLPPAAQKQMRVVIKRFDVGDHVDVTLPKTINLIDSLVTLGILTAARADELKLGVPL